MSIMKYAPRGNQGILCRQCPQVVEFFAVLLSFKLKSSQFDSETLYPKHHLELFDHRIGVRFN